MDLMVQGEIDAASGARTASRSSIMYELDLVTGALQWSEALYTLMHYPRTEPFNRLEWWISHIHPDDAMKLNEVMDRLLIPGIPNWIVEYRFRRADGTYIPVHDRASIMRDGDGKAVRIIGTLSPEWQAAAQEVPAAAPAQS
jgi:PAS domain S-box-containing protein